MYLKDRSQDIVYSYGLHAQQVLNEVTEGYRISEGYVSLCRLQQFTEKCYPADTNLASWMWERLLRDSKFFEWCYPGGEVTGRQYELDVRNVVTGQTREEWLGSSGNLEELRDPALWMVSIDSLKCQYHKLYVHWAHRDGSINTCSDKDRHRQYVSSHGYSTDMRHIDPDILNRQAKHQDINPCFYAVLHEWVLTWL